MDDNGDGLTDRHVTDRSKYGAAAHYRQPVRVGGDNTRVNLRLPQNIPSAVGFLHGYITYRGRATRTVGAASMPGVRSGSGTQADFSFG